MNRALKKIMQLMFAIIVCVFVGSFASGVSTVRAAQTSETVVIEDEETALAATADAGTSAMFLLFGGMLLIILTVVITVVATFVVTAPIADDI